MIDISQLTSLISAFRAETQKDSISPESLGSLLQRIAEIISTATSDKELTQIKALFDNIQLNGKVLVNLAQGSDDRNNLLMNIDSFNFITGAATKLTDQTFIKQATTERAGVMRAQHVDDLYTAKRNITALQNLLPALAEELARVSSQVSSLDSTLTAHMTDSERELNGLTNSLGSLDEMVIVHEQTLNYLNDDVAKQAEQISNIDEMAVSHEETLGYHAEELNNLNEKTSILPRFRGKIVLNSSLATTPILNYFDFNKPDGLYDIFYANMLIARANVFSMCDCKIVEVVGQIFFNPTTVTAHTSQIQHTFLRITPQNELTVFGTQDIAYLNYLTDELKNTKQDKLTAGAGVNIEENVISFNDVGVVSYILEFTVLDGVRTGSFDPAIYDEMRQAIEDGRNIIIKGSATRTNAVSSALGEDYIMLRYSVPRIQDNNSSVTWSVYELRFDRSSYTTKAIHKVIA